jgi:hypothetical protein
VNTFGAGAVLARASTTKTGVQYSPIDLDASLTLATVAVPASEPSVWLVEPQFAIGPTFAAVLGITAHRTALGISYADLRPDLVEVRPATGAAEFEVTPGGDTVRLGPGDTRMRLRIIDVKLTAEPSPGYFAEVTLYSMTLAGWLIDHHRDNEFVVISEAALWPGSHDASELATAVDEIRRAGGTPTPDEMRDALAKDLEPVPLEVFVPEVRRFFIETVPGVLAKKPPGLRPQERRFGRNRQILARGSAGIRQETPFVGR